MLHASDGSVFAYNSVEIAAGNRVRPANRPAPEWGIIAREVAAMSIPSVPFASELFPLRRGLDRLLDEALFGDGARSGWSRNGAVQPMPLDVYATPDTAVILAAVPGMTPGDLEITAHQNTVTLTGKVSSAVDSAEAKGATWYVQELWSGQYRRSITLPFEIDANKATATFEHGIVRVELPKAERARPTRIAVSQGSPGAAIDAANAANPARLADATPGAPDADDQPRAGE